MAEKKKLPEIRFEGFEGEWENWKMQEFGIATGGTSIEAEFCINGKFKVISIGSYSEQSTYTDQGLRANLTEKTKMRVMNQGDLAMVLNDKTASGKILGRVLFIEANESYVYNQRTQRIEPNKDNFNPVFLYQLLNAPLIRKRIVFQSQGNTQIYVNWSAIKETTYSTPTLPEQTQIGTYFQNIDSLISLHQRKYDKLLTVKKAMLEKMFPKEGADVPEIRFKGFEGKWEKKRLGEVAKLGSSKRVHREDYVESGIPFFRGLEISKLGDSLLLDDVLFISENHFIELKEKYGVPQIGDILITAVGTLGNSFLVSDDTPFYFKDGNLIWLREIKINPEYLNLYIGEGIGKKRVLESAAGSNQKALTMVKLQNIQVSIPNDKEQKKIAEYFKHLNILISQHQKQLDKLKNLKKACLEKMFV